MVVMPFFCIGVWFSPKLAYHIIISLALYLPIFYFSFEKFFKRGLTGYEDNWEKLNFIPIYFMDSYMAWRAYVGWLPLSPICVSCVVNINFSQIYRRDGEKKITIAIGHEFKTSKNITCNVY